MHKFIKSERGLNIFINDGYLCIILGGGGNYEQDNLELRTII